MPKPKINRRRGRHPILESLEVRQLLAGDFQPGDSNQDYHFDEADLVQSMKSGKYETIEAADWSDGDWNKDGKYNSSDFVIAFSKNLYRLGPYDNKAGPAVNQLTPLSTTGAADVSIFYYPDTGKVIVFAPAGMTALHLVSRSSSFGVNKSTGLFDVGNGGSQFVLEPNGLTWIENSALLPAAWSDQQVIEDLLVDGARIGGGGIGNVRLAALEDLPAKRPEDALVIGRGQASRSSFVERDEANGLLTYDPQTGDIRIEGLIKKITTVELVSPDGYFTGAAGAGGARYKVGLFDVANPSKLFRLDPRGMAQIDLPGLARTGLSAAEFASGVQPAGAMAGGGPLRLALSVVAPPVLFPGDANGDLFFDESDLIQVMKAGKYRSDDEAIWSDGDWDGDQRFDASDLTTAEQQSGAIYTGNAYSDRAVSRVNQRKALVTTLWSVAIQYDSAHGNIVVASQRAELTSFQLVSASGRFSIAQRAGTFDVASPSSRFVLDPRGFGRLELAGVLPAGLNEQQLFEDLSVDGSFISGGGLGGVSLSVVNDATGSVSGRVVRDFNSNGVLDPDREAGQDNIHVRLESVATSMVHTLRTTSQDLNRNGRIDSLTETGLFAFGLLETGTYRLLIDEAERWATTGANSFEVIVSPNSVLNNLQIGITSTIPADFMPGDANQDFYFDEADWILAMKSGKYGSDRATWSEGDYDGDGDFDSSDVDSAFRATNYQPGGDPYRDTPSVPHHTRTSLSITEDADVYVVYIPASGFFGIVANVELTSLHLHSRSGQFIPSATFGPFDVSSNQSAFWLNPLGIEIAYGKTVQGAAGLTAEELLADLTLDGARLDARPIARAALAIIVPSQLRLRCFEIRAAGAVIGDVNFDGAFNSGDLVTVFQEGEYGDVTPNNSDWFEGDWNCDGDFDSSDIVEAFQNGGFEVEAQPAVAVMAALRMLDPAGLHGRILGEDEFRMRLKKRPAAGEVVRWI